jgi:hypothetical protein
MNNIKKNWKLIIANRGIYETSFGSVSYLPPVENTDINFIHPPVSISSVGLSKYNQFCEGEKDE